MTDERMDERLREYGARWAASRPGPADVPAVPAGRGRSWAPLATAAAVVAVVAGVAYAVVPRGDRTPPPAAGSASPAPRPSYPPCGEEDVRGEVSTRRHAGGVAGMLRLAARGGSCEIPSPPTVEIVGDSLKDVGVTYRFDGPGGPLVLTPTPRPVALRWAAPFCAETSLLVLRVTAGGAAFRLPLDPEVRPPCTGRGASALVASWHSVRCDAAAWEVVSASADVVAAPEPLDGTAVRVSAVLRNVSADHCDVDHQPVLLVRAGRRDVVLAQVGTDDARRTPPLPPGGSARARVTWVSYCGEPLADYGARLRVHDADVLLPLAERPVPPCSTEPGRGADGLAHGTWLVPVA